MFSKFRFEEGAYKSLSGKYGLSLRCHVAKMDDTFSLKTCLNWFDMVLAALDCYCWAFSQGLVTPKVFIGKWELFGVRFIEKKERERTDTFSLKTCLNWFNMVLI